MEVVVVVAEVELLLHVLKFTEVVLYLLLQAELALDLQEQLHFLAVLLALSLEAVAVVVAGVDWLCLEPAQHFEAH